MEFFKLGLQSQDISIKSQIDLERVKRREKALTLMDLLYIAFSINYAHTLYWKHFILNIKPHGSLHNSVKIILSNILLRVISS